MTINVRDFIGPMFGFPFCGTLDYRRLLKLSDIDFTEFYLNLMEEYRDKDGWWKDEKNLPHCSKCNEVISGPRDLRRLAGRSLHPLCLVEEIKIEDKKGLEKKYWERVLKVDFSLLEN
jgi:hypothetical protein